MNNLLTLSTPIRPLSEKYARPLSKLYKTVYGTRPWNEAYTCENQDCPRTNFGQDEVREDLNCDQCGLPLKEYYDENELTREIMEISNRTGFLATLALIDEELVGFWYGWEGSLNELNRQKLGLSAIELAELQKRLVNCRDNPWFYIAEFGIKPELRSSGLGKRLFDACIPQGKGRNVIARTTPRSPAYYINEKYNMRTVWNYTDGSDRVIMAGDDIRLVRDANPLCRGRGSAVTIK